MHLEAWLLANPLRVGMRGSNLAAVLRVDALRGQVDAAAQVAPAVAHPALVPPQHLHKLVALRRDCDKQAKQECLEWPLSAAMQQRVCLP